MINKRKTLYKLLSYVLVAALASGATWMLAEILPNSKLERLANAIDRKYIGQADQTQIQDAAARAMIAATGDRWSYYISAQDYENHVNNQQNSYVGIGVTVQGRQDQTGYDIVAVETGGPAEEAGVQPGDIVTHADGTALGALSITEVKNLIMGEKNTRVVLTLLREEETLEISVIRRTIHRKAARGEMLGETVGYIVIENFHDGAGEESVGAIEELIQQGAEKLIFDVRDNPGGYVDEMVELLDYLLPEGPLFRSVNYAGKEEVEQSDADCLQMPMAVLINANTYSAAEFFAAALREYDWAVTVGEATTGKGYYQTTIELGDGSAVQLSTGAYTTPNGVNLTEVGGLVPDVSVAAGDSAVTTETDPQIQAAIGALTQ